MIRRLYRMALASGKDEAYFQQKKKEIKEVATPALVDTLQEVMAFLGFRHSSFTTRIIRTPCTRMKYSISCNI